MTAERPVTAPKKQAASKAVTFAQLSEAISRPVVKVSLGRRIRGWLRV